VSHLDRRQLLKIFGAAAAAGLTSAAAGCSSEPEGTEMEQPSGRTISLGLVAPALGPYAKIGDDITKGFKLYLTDHNNLIGRHKVALRTAEEGPGTDDASKAVKGLLDDGVIAIAGVANPDSLTVIAPLVDDARVPLISAHASPSNLLSAAYVWRVSDVEGESGRALAPYAKLSGSRTFILSDDSTDNREEASEFKAAFLDLKGTQVVGEQVGKGNFPLRLQQAAAAHADTIFAAYTGSDALSLLQAYKNSGLVTKLLGPGSLTESADLTKLGQLPARVYTSMYYASDLDNEDNRRFVSSYHKVHGVQPSAYAMAAYDTASVLDKAFRLVEGDPNSFNLNRALTQLGQIDSPRGAWVFNAKRTPQQKWYLRRLRLDGMVPANMLDSDLAVLS
jgi:branched-chain amino acid transport system substrate-binding protein